MNSILIVLLVAILIVGSYGFRVQRLTKLSKAHFEVKGVVGKRSQQTQASETCLFNRKISRETEGEYFESAVKPTLNYFINLRLTPVL